MNRSTGPCLCGDPECPRCFPQPDYEPSSDEVYEADRQRRIDEGIDSMNITIRQASTQKRALEDTISLALSEYERETGLQVSSINVSRVCVVGKESRIRIRIEAELP